MTPMLVGANSTLLATWRGPGNRAEHYGKTRWLCQTFPLATDNALFRICVRSNTVDGDKPYYCSIYATDVQGKPTGSPIATSVLPPEGESTSFLLKWRVFTFDDFPQLAAGQYAFELYVPDAEYTFNYHAYMDRVLPIYPDGKAWLSLDNGGTWSPYDDWCLLFEVWGYQPPPDPPPPPEIINWAPIDKTEVSLITGFKIQVTTDRPCHLFMRWTKEEPLKHPSYRFQRGIRLMTGLRYCFVAYHENEQLEEGDTYIHTFEKRDWPVCETRWFYFIGTVVAQESPSCSPIFHLHRTAVFIPSTFGPRAGTLSNRHIQASDVHWSHAHDALSGTIPDSYLPPICNIFAGEALTVSYWIYRGFLFFNTIELEPGSQFISADLSLYAVSSQCSSSTAHPNLQITRGVQNDPIIPSNYGLQLPFTEVGGQIDFRDLLMNQYNPIPLNAFGFTILNPGGTTRFCLRGQQDVEDRQPPLGVNRCQFKSTQQGDGFWPLLTVTYVPP